MRDEMVFIYACAIAGMAEEHVRRREDKQLSVSVPGAVRGDQLSRQIRPQALLCYSN